MKWIDYREKLGIGFNDEEKKQMFSSKISNRLLGTFQKINTKKELVERFERIVTDYYIEIGEAVPLHISVFHFISNISRSGTIVEMVCKYVAFLNILKKSNLEAGYLKFRDLLEKSLLELNIAYDIYDDGIFIFPKGAKELDNALVSEPLEWLIDFPNTRKTYIIALKQYSDGIYIRDVADNLRKAFETFLQEFLKNTKNLETNKNSICKYLGEQGVDAGITGLLKPLLDSYKNINDRTAKHNDAVEQKLLEFLLYQTGVFIRMIISVSHSEEKNI
mgnify:FL=1